MPNFASSIHLIAPRNLAQRLAEKYSDQIPSAVLAWLKTLEAYPMLQECIGRQLTQTAHDTDRKEIYSGELLKPSFIVLTASGKQTLDETVTSLKNAGLAHHFIINVNGNIHPVTQENEVVDEALKHRFYTVGLSGHVIDGCYEQRDMNSASISISTVGEQNKELTLEQADSLATLIQYLQKNYCIRPDQVLDYGCIACFADGKYGRRKPNAFLPWKKLQEKGLAIYPQDNISKRTMVNFATEEERVLWVCQALRKIGYICPITHDANHEHFKAAIASFTLHTANNGYDPRHQDCVIGNLNSMIIQHEEHNPKLQTIQPPALPLRPEE